MAIPRVLYQTFKTYAGIPLSTRLQMRFERLHCLGWRYEFYDDDRIIEFLHREYGGDVVRAYDRLAIGANKADFFRYSVLYKYGGVYLDIDSQITARMDSFVEPEDRAIIALEGNKTFFVQWALFYEAGHPFLAKTLDLIIDNIATNRFPCDGHSMTGPTPYTKAIKEVIAGDPSVSYRQMDIDYHPMLNFSRPHQRTLYKQGGHWRDRQVDGVLKG